MFGVVHQVPDGLHFGVRSPDLPEHGRLGPDAQLQTLHGHGVPTQSLPKGALALTWTKDAPPAPNDRTPDKDTRRKDLHQAAACRTKAGQTDGTPQLMDIGGDAETHQLESLRKAETRAGPDKDTTAGTVDSGGVEGGHTEASRDGRRRRGAAFDRDLPLPHEAWRRVMN